MNRVIEEIVASNDWRDGEFAKMKVNAHAVEEVLWCRMCVPMIYAHWEGYVVTSLRILIDHLNELGLVANEMPTKLVVVGLADSYKKLSGKQSFEQKIDFTNRFRQLLQETVKFTKRIDTRSNLKSEVLKDLCTMYGFEYSRFNEISADIDRLVHIRNSIAHGENSFVVTMENISRYIDAVTKAMDFLREEIDQFLRNEHYRMMA